MSETVAETATAAENGEQQNHSMEKLQLDEEDEKNISAEDILGDNTLQMSESEGEESPKKAPTGKQNRRQRMEDSDDEEQGEQIEAEQLKPKKKVSALIDSDSEEEQIESKGNSGQGEQVQDSKASSTTSSKKTLPVLKDSNSEKEQGEATDEKEMTNEQQDQQNALKPMPRKKICAIIDSDSEEEPSNTAGYALTEGRENSEDEDQSIKKDAKPKKKISAIIDTDSEEEQQVEPKEHKPRKKNKKSTHKKQQVVDSEEEQNAQSSADDTGATNKLKGVVDSESESEHNADEPMEPQDKPNKSKPMRASAKKAMDEMQAIQSEQQRLHREAHISVPYHQPKPRTLKEFLSRRTINKPLAVALAGGSPIPNKTQPRRSLALRMNSEELQAYAKLMEERAKEATEFFKSVSEPENEDSDEADAKVAPTEIKDNCGVLDLPNEGEDQQAILLETVEASEVPETQIIDVINEMEAAIETAPETELMTEDISPTKVRLVTEVVELPRLDLSTLNITPPSKPATPRITEAIRRLKDEKSSDVSPSLKGDANMVIDLETGDMFAKKPTGVDDLLHRLMKTREAKKHKTTETVNILSTEHGKLELSKVSIHLHEEEPVNKEQKPGAAYIKMQEQLKSLITKKRMEELRKKRAEEIEGEHEEDMDIDEEEYEPDEKPSKSQVIINDDEELVDEELQEGATYDELEDAEVESAGEADGEAELEDELEATSSSDSEHESETKEDTQAGKRKNRIIRAFHDDNSDEDDVDFLQTPKPSNTPPVTATQLQLSANKLFDTEIQRTASDEENELLGLCSGKFTQSEMSSAAPTAGALISQIPITQAPTSSQAPDELQALCSGSFDTQAAPLPEPATNKILSSDEEPAKVKELEAEKPRQKKLTKKRQKKKAKLGFSDDEESDEDLEEEEQQDSDVEQPEEEVPESFVDYDSEENEIVVQMTKKDRKIRAANFVEKEAELSESEWGSADEDEKNMDKYDIELGDEDEFDREKLHHELEQIHARKMLDKDIREVKKIQDMLFEDDEGAVRQRQFRWKNAENGLGFSLDDSRKEHGDGEANEGSGDEENEHLWRKIRYEREQLLLEKAQKGEAAGSASPLTPTVVNSNTASGTVRKFTIITAKKTTVEVKKSSPFLISKSLSTTQHQPRAVRGSFLVRDKETLSKLAGMTKGAAGDVDGTAGTVSIKSAKAKNFVFATLTEEEHENQKRKAADLLNSSSETGINFMKKPRLEPRREKCLIDQLL